MAPAGGAVNNKKACPSTDRIANVLVMLLHSSYCQ